jgi:hypothetical protein
MTFCGLFLIVLFSMAVSASDVGRPSVARRLFELDPLPPERLKLETAPRVDTVASFVFTRAAERSWEVSISTLPQTKAPSSGLAAPQDAARPISSTT